MVGTNKWDGETVKVMGYSAGFTSTYDVPMIFSSFPDVIAIRNL
jgi:hypothetical protein